MKKLLSIFLIFFVLSGYSQIQNFPNKVRFAVVPENNAATRVAYLTALGDLVYKDESVSGNNEHNSLTGLQGGLENEYYHLNASQYARMLELIYEEHTYNFNISPTYGEKGISNEVSVSFNIISNDDEFTSAEINPNIGAVGWDQGSYTLSAGNFLQSTNISLTRSFIRNQNNQSQTANLTYQAYVPQWAGSTAAAITDFNDYNTINNNLQKFIQSPSNLITKTFTVANGYLWFISVNNPQSIKDVNGFEYTKGAWGDNNVFWWTKSFALTLSDNTTTETIYITRSRELHTLTNFVFTFKN